jgi:hypothetical protein
MIRAYFRNTIFISLCGHIIIFMLFSFSFGKAILKTGYAPLVFWGQILPKTDLIFKNNNIAQKLRKSILRTDISVLDKMEKGSFSISEYNLKPASALAFDKEKTFILPFKTPELTPPAKKESVIMFHPLLPYQLQLYFKDRQAVHIELMFNIIPGEQKNSILIKRKISSGNLEADLLSARYFGHYLFIQQGRFLPDSWQTVKIDLSTQK